MGPPRGDLIYPGYWEDALFSFRIYTGGPGDGVGPRGRVSFPPIPAIQVFFHSFVLFFGVFE